ncbi:hypothetical protein AHAS_Ahas11G0052700 [Arachis hypogaea]|uniref:Uncharacterized protein n=1 Tax=Arachis hypogaea TaxID=3818 RepID=A0A445ANF8_ARAHY|nr:hypothetical protein Ahy_B01g052027 [Arachis hypogaea]
MEIEQQDESSRMLSQNNSLAQALGKEDPSRVHGVSFGPTPNQLCGRNSHMPRIGVQIEEIQRVLLELQVELEAEKLKKKAVEDEVVIEKKKRQAMECALRYLIQRQGEELPPDIAARMNFLEG